MSNPAAEGLSNSHEDGRVHAKYVLSIAGPGAPQPWDAVHSQRLSSLLLSTRQREGQKGKVSHADNVTLLRLSLGPVLVDGHKRVAVGSCPHDANQLFLVVVHAVCSLRVFVIPLPVKISAASSQL